MLKRMLDTIAVLAMITASSMVIWAISRHIGGVPPPSPDGTPAGLPEAISLEGSHVTGDPDARLGMIIFSDFECSFSRAFAQETLPALLAKYVQRGDLVVAFWHLPAQNHSSALEWAAAAFCAGRQGKFWEMHDLLFVNQSDFHTWRPLVLARELDLDLARLRFCVDSEAPTEIAEQVALAKALGVASTPAFLVGTHHAGRVSPMTLFSGAKPLVRFESVLDALLRNDTLRAQ